MVLLKKFRLGCKLNVKIKLCRTLYPQIFCVAEKAPKPELDSKKGSNISKDLDSKSPIRESPKANKSKLYADLFDSSQSEPKAEEPEATKATPEKTKPKNKQEVTFDDDSNLLNEKGKNTDPDFMNSLLGESSLTKSKGKMPSNEFVLPDKYKENTHKSPTKKSSGLLDDLFGDTGSRPRRQTTLKTNKTFEIDDDDILGSKSAKKSQDPDNRRNSKKGDWLFGSPQGTPLKMKEEMDNRGVADTVGLHSGTLSSPQKEGDWLNQMLTANKSSPSRQGAKFEVSVLFLMYN